MWRQFWSGGGGGGGRWGLCSLDLLLREVNKFTIGSKYWLQITVTKRTGSDNILVSAFPQTPKFRIYIPDNAFVWSDV